LPALYQHDPFLLLQGFLWQGALRADQVWMALTTACEGWAMVLIALLFSFLCLWRPRAALLSAVPALVALLLAGAIAQALKALVDTPRPLEVLGPAQVHVLLEPLRQRAFPSGHSASAAALATWGLVRFGRRAWPLVLLAFLGGLSRVYVGAHWTIDVLGGWAVGVLSTALVYWAAGRFVRPRPGQPARPAGP
jgi:membrane-associated phospholipid phosphatase